MNLDDILCPFVAYAGRWGVVSRGGHPLLLLPVQSWAARQTLELFQPQRFAARIVVGGIRVAVALGMQRILFGRKDYQGGQVVLVPEMPAIHPGSCGFLLGSPDHRVKRAVACYETAEGWEVAKVAFGDEGRQMLEREADALRAIGEMTSASPAPLGLHHGGDVAVLRMPYLEGSKLAPGESWDVCGLLNDWILDQPAQASEQFPEWRAIEKALADVTGGGSALERLAGRALVPVIRHGDFTRWNLRRQSDGRVRVIDWEWGHAGGMPGIDLVHYHAQDARLVRRLAPPDVLDFVRTELAKEEARSYLQRTGWNGDVDELILAAIAYPVGAGHQENSAVLREALALCAR